MPARRTRLAWKNLTHDPRRLAAACAGIGFAVLLIFACLMYVFGVHLPTITINIPLNNRLQSLDLYTATESELQEIAELFESRWLRWNTIRTAVAILTTLMLLVLLLRL